MKTIRAFFMTSVILAAGPLLAAETKAPAARLIHAAGGVTIESKDGGRPGQKGALLDNGETVTTAAGAVAVIEMPDGSRLKLRESSRASVTWPGPKNDKLAEVFLSFGSVFAKVT